MSASCPAIPPEDRPAIDRVVELLGPARSLLFITGAGMSADSGVPTYRGIGGLYDAAATEEGMPIEEALSREMLAARPEVAWKYLAQIGRAVLGATFNRGHQVIAEMEAGFDRVWVLTQNIDGFHRQAGSKHVLEIHGSMRTLTCMACGFRPSLASLDPTVIPPRCPRCGGVVRPDVVLFGEALPTKPLGRLWTELEKGFDVVFTIGTSSVFPYIAGPVAMAKNQGWATVEINPAVSKVSHLVDIRVAMGAAAALDAIWRRHQERHGN